MISMSEGVHDRRSCCWLTAYVRPVDFMVADAVERRLNGEGDVRKRSDNAGWEMHNTLYMYLLLLVAYFVACYLALVEDLG